ncbi:MAG TPA: DUF1460 domain-containing protein, partial [Saprospiraceae bacterium]|nr:DUF1460 domain-containing protein [Saprospiraceae bacterium]
MPNNTTMKAMDSKTDNGFILINEASKYLGKPYVAGSLDKEEIEQLTIDTSGFDCYTLVETVVAKSTLPSDIANKIQQLRYRDGVIKDYTSRIHYFLEWIYENSKNGILQDVTSSFECAQPYAFDVHYMSSNPKKYQQLDKNPDLVSEIKSYENKINNLKFQYIPKNILSTCTKK